MMARPAGVILAGGRSSRMGNADKALLSLDNELLLSRVIRLLQPQVGSLLLSSGSQGSKLESFGLPLVYDLLSNHRGPLTGLCSALQYLVNKDLHDGLVLCPCDAPFVPLDLVEKLTGARDGNPESVVVVSYEGILQPTFSLWQNHHFPVIHDELVKQGGGGLKYILGSLPHIIVEWVSAEPPPFYNINTREQLETAANWLAK